MSRDAAALSLKSNRTLRFGGNFTALIVSRIHLEDGSLSLELGYVIAGHLFRSGATGVLYEKISYIATLFSIAFFIGQPGTI